MTTLGPNKGTHRPGPGLRWLKVRRPRLDARAPVTVCYSIWRCDETRLCARTFTMRDDLDRPTAARLVREARSYVLGLGRREAQRAASARRQAEEARAAARRALG